MADAMFNSMRTDDGERFQKMRKIASLSSFEMKMDRKKQNVVDFIRNIDFPTIERRIAGNQGKFVKLSLQNEKADINEAHPKIIGQFLKQYFQGNLDQQKRKNAILIKTKDKRQFDTVMNLKEEICITVFGKSEKILVEEMMSRNTSKGIIFCKSWTQMTLEEVKAGLMEENKIRDVRQMEKFVNGQKQSTDAYVITFDGADMPGYVFMYSQRYEVRKYYPSPLICGNCLKFGHIKVNCRQQNETCRKCGIEKELEVHVCQIDPKCPNCPEGENNHAPNRPRECGKLELEKEIIKYRINYGVTNGKAKEAVCKSLLTDNAWTSQSTRKDKVGNETVTSKVSEPAKVTEKMSQLRNEIDRERKELMELKKLEAELTQIRDEKKRTLQNIYELQRENKTLDDELQNTTSGDVEMTEMASKHQLDSHDEGERSGKRAMKNYNTVKSIKTPKVLQKNPPQHSKLLSKTELEEIRLNLKAEQLKSMDSVEQKAHFNLKEITWYINDGVMVPVQGEFISAN